VTVDVSDGRQGRQRRHLRLLAVLAVGMFGFGFALVPLYGLFCEVTGVQRGGLAGVAVPGPRTATGPVLDREVVVKFDGTVHPDLPWDFEPKQRRLVVHPGATYEVRFEAANRSNKRVTGQAIPAIAPWQATGFFHKLECFCFRQQTLQAGEVRRMPVVFVVDPALPRDINTITLSYTFFEVAGTQGRS